MSCAEKGDVPGAAWTKADWAHPNDAGGYGGVGESRGAGRRRKVDLSSNPGPSSPEFSDTGQTMSGGLVPPASKISLKSFCERLPVVSVKRMNEFMLKPSNLNQSGSLGWGGMSNGSLGKAFWIRSPQRSHPRARVLLSGCCPVSAQS